MNLTGVDILGN